MRRPILLAAVVAGALLAGPAGAADDATWVHDVATDGGDVEVTVSLSVGEPTFPADLPLGYRHFLIEDDGTPSGRPATGTTVAWQRGEDSGEVEVDGDGAVVVPSTPFRRRATPALGTAGGDRHTLTLSLPAGDYALYSDLVDLGAPTTRVAGDDRYATAAAASARFFRPGVEVAYVASGEAFPDALAAGPAAARRDAPLLLTAQGSLPQATRDELRRLAPDTILLVGGEAAVNAAVERELQPYGGSVRRIAGDDRYDTAARIARDAWGRTTVDAAYVANGDGFADALGASARAAVDGVPVLLVQRDAVPTTTADTLDVLGVDAVTVAGGTTVVTEPTRRALADRVGSAVRRAGPDRYATSAALADRPGRGRTLLVATGTTFPDGLTAGSLARHLDADLLLSAPTDVPEVVADRAGQLAPRRVYALGGTSALSRTALRAFDQHRTPLTPLYRDPVLDRDGATTFTVD